MAITQNSLTSGTDSTDTTVYTTASVAPASNQLLLLAVMSGKTGGGDVPDSVVGNGLTWVQIATQLQNRRVTLYRAMGSSPSSGTIVITFPATQESVHWHLSEFAGVDTTGSNGAGATNSDSNVATNNATSATTLTVTLAAFSGAGNATFGCFHTTANSSSFTEGTGFTLITTASGVSLNMGSATEWRNDNDTSVDMTIPSGNVAGIALELFAPAVAGLTPRSYPRGANRGIMRGAA